MTNQKNRNSSPITMADVANKAGVSTKTVSRVLNNNSEVSEKTRQHIQEVIKQLGYRPNHAARSLASKRSNVIGLMIPNLANPFFPRVIRGIEHVSQENGYYAIQNGTSHDTKGIENSLRLFEEMRVEGLIIYSAHLTDQDITALLQRQPNVVLINRLLQAVPGSSVCVGSYEGVFQVVDYLLRQGRKNVAYLGSPLPHYTATERKRGFEDAVKKHGFDPKNLPITSCNDSLSEAYAAGVELVKSHSDIDAIVCYNDIIAGGVLKACAELKINVPGDIAVTGFDDIEFAQVFNPPLTTLRVPKFELGLKAAELLFKKINGEPHAHDLKIMPELIVRQSA